MLVRRMLAARRREAETGVIITKTEVRERIVLADLKYRFEQAFGQIQRRLG